MFKKLEKTNYPPKSKPLMVWDGDCGFCKYWIIRWKLMTGNRIDYKAYQEVHQDFNDIDMVHFKEAVRLIEPSGKIFNGPEAAYRTYLYGHQKEYLFPLYRRFSLFRKISDYGYDWIARNRSFMMKVTLKAFGKDPRNLRPYWVLYLIGLAIVLRVFKR